MVKVVLIATGLALMASQPAMAAPAADPATASAGADTTDQGHTGHSRRCDRDTNSADAGAMGNSADAGAMGTGQTQHHKKFLCSPDSIAVALGALGAFGWGLSSIWHQGHDHRPTSP